MRWYSQRFQVVKCSNTPKLYTLKASSVKIGSISFFSCSDMQKWHHFLGCHVIGINSSLAFFLRSLRFPNLKCQAKSLIRITVSRSFSSKLLSRLIFLRCIDLYWEYPFHYKKIRHYQNPYQNRVYFHLRTKQYKVF